MSLLRHYTLLIGAIAAGFNSVAQISPDALGYYEDAARFSFQKPTGSARFQAMGGAQTALGADISSGVVNPAGLGVYNRSELTISPAVNVAGANSTYMGPTETTSLKDSRFNLNFGNFGVVISSVRPDDEERQGMGGTFAISHTRTNNFQNKRKYIGNNNVNSLRNFFVESMEGTHFNYYDNQFLDYGGIIDLEGLAYYGWLANSSWTNDTVYNTPDNGSNVVQSEEIRDKGAQYQWDLAYGYNIADRIYIGASFGIARARYDLNRIYQETVEDSGADSLSLFRLNQDYSVRGTGINFKAGIIARLTNKLRWGFSFQTPTWYNMKELSSAQLDAEYLLNIASQSSYSYETLQLEFKYKMQTPMRINSGLAYFFGKDGFLTGDIEFVNYKSATVANRDENEFQFFGLFDEDNNTINQAFRPAFNGRLGGEVRQGVMRYRAGMAYYMHPYKNFDGNNRDQLYISAGLGIRMPEFYVDFSVSRTSFKTVYSPYTLESSPHPVVESKNSNLNFMITWGTFFE